MPDYKMAKSFFTDFQGIFLPGSERYAEAIKIYQYNKAFTVFIVKEINNIIEKYGYIPQNEYFRIDAIGYCSRYKELEGSKLNPYLWDLKVAVEHENNDMDWLDEVIKLAHICCPLRVVIGYLPAKKRYQEIEYLSNAADALEKVECRYNLQHGEFMVILGNSRVDEQKDYFSYRAYVLQENAGHFKFCPLEEVEKK